jgi:nitroreductase
MKFQELISSTRTIHGFTDEKIPDAIINNVIELALMAPNHKFTFPWKFLLLGEKTQSKIFENALKLKFGETIPSEERDSMQDKLLNPRMLFVIQKRNEDTFTSKEDYATIACSVQILALALAEQKIGYKWSTAKFSTIDSTYKLLDLNIQNEEIVGCILIGKPKGEPKKRVRPSVSEVLTILP